MPIHTDGKARQRPDRAVIVYSQKAKQCWKNVPIVIGGIEASLRRNAHYDYWSEQVRRSVLLDAKADLLLYGNAERAIVDIAHRMAAGEQISAIRDVRGSAYCYSGIRQGWTVIDSTKLDSAGAQSARRVNPYTVTHERPCVGENTGAAQIVRMHQRPREMERDKTVVRLPSFEQVEKNKILYAHSSRVFHLETNPGNARALVQQHGKKNIWLNPPPLPLETEELDRIYELPYSRKPHPCYGKRKNPAWEMIRFSINIMRGCFGGCTFCSITEHEGRIIQKPLRRFCSQRSGKHPATLSPVLPAIFPIWADPPRTCIASVAAIRKSNLHVGG